MEGTDAKTGNSATNDRMIYVRSTGQVTFGINDGGQRTISTTESRNDNQWHHVVGTYAGGAMKLYVDGALVGSQTIGRASLYYGWWRIGADSIGNWSGGNATLTGLAIDEAAVYPYALDAAQVESHFTAR